MILQFREKTTYQKNQFVTPNLLESSLVFDITIYLCKKKKITLNVSNYFHY